LAKFFAFFSYQSYKMMPQKQNKISLIYFVIFTLLLVGLVPLVLTGWFLSERSAKELRAVENRYQTQLVQEKARQIEMFGQKYSDLVSGFAESLELTGDISILSSTQIEQKLSKTLGDNANVLALHIKPLNAESLSVYRSEVIKRDEVEKIAAESLINPGKEKLFFGEPKKIDSSNEMVLTISAPVIIGETPAAMVSAVVSLREISRSIVGTKSFTEEELWKAGLPIVFVVDDKGRAVFHPDAKLVTEQKTLTNLRIVQEWLQASRQIQSALVPFSAEFNGETHEMIGAYSTISFGKKLNFGVITMQDENKALASVGEMRQQTWVISLAFAVFALIVGLVLSRQMTSPLLKLSSAAQKIAEGDYSTKVETKNITEIGELGKAFNLMSDNVEEHIQKLAHAAQENRELFVGTVKALAAAIDGKDRYTRGHSERVSRFSVAIGKRLGMSADDLETLRISALLHDVGKIAIDDNILKKPAALTDDEFEVMKQHPQRGFKIMSQIPGMDNFLPGMYMHHEMVNGKGYPQGLYGDQIPLQAKIVSVADTFDAMTTDRPYQKGMSLEDSINRIRSFVGTRYDGQVVEALVHACADGSVRAVGTVRQKPETAEMKQTQEIIKAA
jgi:HD-GYP domain-containing protein (c-di-GMP phosphodiesterase class II)